MKQAVYMRGRRGAGGELRQRNPHSRTLSTPPSGSLGERSCTAGSLRDGGTFQRARQQHTVGGRALGPPAALQWRSLRRSLLRRAACASALLTAGCPPHSQACSHTSIPRRGTSPLVGSRGSCHHQGEEWCSLLSAS